MWAPDGRRIAYRATPGNTLTSVTVTGDATPPGTTGADPDWQTPPSTRPTIRAPFVPPWTRYLAAGWISWSVVGAFFPEAPFSLPNTRTHVVADSTTALHWVALVAFFNLAGVAAQVYRYRRVSGEEDRRRTKWVVVCAAVANGEAIFGPGIARRVMGLFSAPRLRSPQAFLELTEREEEILALIAGGHDNAEIAARLFLSVKTVQNRVSNIFRKLRVADRVQAALRAREAGLGADRGSR